MRILSDKRGVRGGSQYTSLVDRAYRTTDASALCPTTGMPVVPIHYMNLAGVGSGQVYTEGEVIHISKWSPSKLYGRSPVATMWRQVNTLIAMDNYVYSAYQKRRMPRGVMVIKSSNMETVSFLYSGGIDFFSSGLLESTSFLFFFSLSGFFFPSE